jgi:hypothetical protein
VKIKSTILLTVLAFVSVAASAQSKINDPALFGEISYVSLSVKDSGFSVSPAAMRGILGYNINQNFDVEGMLGFGIKNDTITVSGVSADIKVGTMVGAYLKPKVNLSSDVELFARLGYAKSGLEASARGYTFTGSGSDTSYGAGMKFKVANNTSLVMDYMSYYDKDGTKATGFSVGMGFKF